MLLMIALRRASAYDRRRRHLRDRRLSHQAEASRQTRKGNPVSTQQDYWLECVASAAEECDLKMSPEQLKHIASAAESGHENYYIAYYSPPSSGYMASIEDKWKAKLAALQAEFDAYRNNSETAVKRALNLSSNANITIGRYGIVTRG